MIETNTFLDTRRLLHGPWQAFERDVARLLFAHGFSDVRIIGRSHDAGGDVLGILHGELWVVQCKHTSTTAASAAAVEEVVNAAQYYKAQKILVAVSRPPSEALLAERARFARLGLQVDLADPASLLSFMGRAPEYSPSRRALYAYQEEAALRVRSALVETGRGLLVIATGLGKTVIMSEVVADLLRNGRVQNNRVLVLAHTTELVDQLHRQFWFQLPRWIHTHQLSGGEEPSFWDGITFSTIQSAAARAGTLPSFGLVIVDEAHHGGARTFQRVLEQVGAPMLAGMTATPWRGDSYDIENLFGQPVFQMGIAEGLAQGFLSNVDYRLLADNVDWAVVQERSNYSYSLKQLNRRLLIPTRDEEAARIILRIFEETGRRAAIVFSPTVIHAEAFAAVLRSAGFLAEPLYGTMPGRERDRLLSHFRAGAFQVIVTVDLFNEGVDLPDVDLIVFMRSTHSRRIFVQQLGRGLRLAPNKDNVVVLDFVTDLRRVAEVVELDRAVRAGSIEHLNLGPQLVSFGDESAGSFLHEWMLDQASLILRSEDPLLSLPDANYPTVPPPGSVQ